MTAWEKFKIYRSAGADGRAPQGGQTIPEFDESGWKRLHDPVGYEADEGLEDAVNVALNLGLPLLLTGEAGTGKTELAHSIAARLNAGDALVFNAKSTSTYTDLLYRYDALWHFQEARIRQVSAPIEKYIKYEPLGQAILLAADRMDPYLPEEYRNAPQRRSVVLVL